MSFFTSFSYAYYAAFMHKLDENAKEIFSVFDTLATFFFVGDIVFNLMVDEKKMMVGL